MKKEFVTLLSALLLAVVPAFAGDEITEDQNGYHPYKSVENFAEPNSHWGMYVNGGFSRFDGDGPYGISKAPFNMDFHLGATYDFTPLWGLQIDLGRTGYGLNVFKETDENVGGKYVGHMYNVGADLTFNFMNAFFPKRQHTLFNLYANVGGGLGLYTLKGPDDMYFNAHADANNDATYAAGLPKFSSEKRKVNFSPYIDVSMLMSFNLTRTFALGVKAGYMMFFNDYVDGNAQPRISSKDANGNWYTDDQIAIKQSKANRNNDGMWVCALQAHWNFIAKKDSHVRNYANQNVFDQQIADRKAKAAEEAKAAWTPQKDTLVISHKDTLVVKNEVKEAAPLTDLSFVYFDNNKATLNERGHIEVQQMAARLNANPDACLELSGHTDASGSDKYNAKLAEQRAQAVRDELIKVYGIDESRLVDLGRGKLTNVNASFGPNRRVDMRVVTREEVEQIRKEKENAKKQAEAPKVEAPKAEEAAPVAEVAPAPEKSEAEKLSEVKAETYDTDMYIAVEKTGVSTTLSKLARKHYNNTNCWVYIYLANKDVIKSPSYLWPNTKLYIPRLTEEQMAITKEEAAKLVGE